MHSALLFSLLVLLPLTASNVINVREERAAVNKPPGNANRESGLPVVRDQGLGGDKILHRGSQDDGVPPLPHDPDDFPGKPAVPMRPGGELGNERVDHMRVGGDLRDKPGAAHRSLTPNIATSFECSKDVKRFCADTIGDNNFMVLDCLQDNQKTDDQLSKECHHFLWNLKRNLTLDIRFDKTAQDACMAEYQKIPDCAQLEMGQGLIIPCLVEHYDEIFSKPCLAFVNKMASIVFSDYRFMDRFMGDCHADIQDLKCGRMEGGEDDDSPHSQGKVVECLIEHKPQLNRKCKKALLKVAELQADDYHLDRPLYYACRDDREHFCADVTAGDGEIFKCLYKNIGNKKLTQECRERLEIRQQLIAEDVKINKAFYSACREDMKANQCGNEGTGTLEDDLGRNTILLCLEAAQNNDVKIHPQCQQEMFDMRRELMQDYKLSPELVSACQIEIQSHCRGGLAPGGETIDCLLRASMKKEKKKRRGEGFSDECRAELEILMHVADPGEDIRVDEPLFRACGEVITDVCRNNKNEDGDVITCLLENLDHEDMTDECEDHLLVIQYFAIRDFKLDHHLFKACRKDAKKLCQASEYDNPKSLAPEQGPRIFTCLYMHKKSEDDSLEKPSRPCMHEMTRVMRERSTRMELHPEVEDACIKDLADKCSDDEEHTEEGAEMECLQDNYDDLTPECQAKVAAFTEEEADDFHIDKLLMEACTPMIENFCKSQLNVGAMPEEVLECLIEHKRHGDMSPKCAAGIEHHQLISLKDFKFNKKFREACQASVSMFCPKKKTKYEVVACLSEHVRNDTLLDMEQRVEKNCQRQLKFEFLQRGESFKLDKEMEQACGKDKETFCANKNAGEAEIIECLRSHKKKLSDECHKLIFRRQQEEAVMGDWNLRKTCQMMIIKYDCNLDQGETETLKCLKENKEDHGFDSRCRKLVQKRLIEQNQDVRLDINLHKACQKDIVKFCSDIFDRDSETKPMEGKVINCLKKKFAVRPKVLSMDCEREIAGKIRDTSLDINQNPVVMKICKSEIKRHCLDGINNIRRMSVDEDDLQPYQVNTEGAIMECLKKNFQLLKDPDCKKEIAYAIQESKVDIHVDPLLQTSCQKDLVGLCNDVPQGQGRLMSCLLAYLEKNPESLTRECRVMIQGRKDLWEYAAQVAPPETFGEVAEQVMLSPSRNYFMAIFFTAVGIIFIMGLGCGRVTKRVRAELKNK